MLRLDSWLSGSEKAPIVLIAQQSAKIFFRLTHHHQPLAVRCIWATCFLIRTPTHWLDFGACAVSQFFIRWDGMTTVYQPSGAYKIFTVSRATRRSNMSQVSNPRFVVIRQKIPEPCRSRDQISLNYATSSQPKMKKFLKICFVAWVYQSTGVCSTQRLVNTLDALRNRHFYAILNVVRRTHKKRRRFGMLILVQQLHKPNLKIANDLAHFTN